MRHKHWRSFQKVRFGTTRIDLPIRNADDDPLFLYPAAVGVDQRLDPLCEIEHGPNGHFL